MQIDQTPPGREPFSQSTISLEKTSPGDSGLLENGRVVAAGRGVGWFGTGFDLFKRSPGIWIANVIIMFLIIMVISLVPILGSLAVNLLWPIMTAGLMMGCLALERGDELEIEHLFAGFKQHGGQLALVGVFYLVGIFAVMIVAMVMIFLVIGGTGLAGMISGGGSQAVTSMLIGGAGIGLLLVVLVATALIMPLAMAIWFAPALVVFHGLDALSAMKQSFYACLKNIGPFLVYGLVYLVLAVLACIPLMLGWLVLIPVGYGSIYAAYKDIFLADAASVASLKG